VQKPIDTVDHSNAGLTNERRKRLTETDTVGFLRALSRLAVSVDHRPDEAQASALARRYGLTVYDEVYLDLARREDIPLATLDARLAAARGEKVRLIDRSNTPLG
jgi:predicted nucleic acid-binding protein